MELNDLLMERLIKYPESVFDKFNDTMTRYVLSHYYYKYAVPLGLPEHQKATRDLLKQNGQKLIRDPKIADRGKSTKATFEEIIVDWPKGYPEPEPDFDQLTFIVTKEEPDRPSKMEYDPDLVAIYAFLPQYMLASLEAPDADDAYEDVHRDLSDMILLMRYDLGHELMHFVQDKSIGQVYSKKDRYKKKNARRLDKSNQTIGVGDPIGTGQNKQLRGYSRQGKNYYLSPNEYDTTIRSEIGEFFREYNPEQNLTTQIRDHLSIGTTRDPTFFSILRKHDEPRYQRAAKKFVTGINDVLSNGTQ
jgi:hypothetical protein